MTSMVFSTLLLYIHEGMNLIAHFSDSSHSLQISLNSSCVVEGLLPEDEEVRGTLDPYHVARTNFHRLNKSPPVRFFNLEATSCTLQNNETKNVSVYS